MLIILLAVLEVFPWGLKFDHSKCYVQDDEIESVFYSIPCDFIDDNTIPDALIKDYLLRCFKDKSCKRIFV